MRVNNSRYDNAFRNEWRQRESEGERDVKNQLVENFEYKIGCNSFWSVFFRRFSHTLKSFKLIYHGHQHQNKLSNYILLNRQLDLFASLHKHMLCLLYCFICWNCFAHFPAARISTPIEQICFLYVYLDWNNVFSVGGVVEMWHGPRNLCLMVSNIAQRQHFNYILAFDVPNENS